MSDYLILGSGLSGLSCSYHIGHEKCLILEEKSHAYGHIHSELRDGFTWDQGPHVSFTKHQYVRDLFAKSVKNEYVEQEVSTVNYYHGSWINHPAQSNLYQIPEPLRSECLESFLGSRNQNSQDIKHYGEWLDIAFGKVFAETFPYAYTRKYWTVEPSMLTTSWVGKRVFKPESEDVILGATGQLSRQTHYIQNIRYPTRGGYKSYANLMRQGANIRFGSCIQKIDLKSKSLWTSQGVKYTWNKLINTIPLPVFISMCIDAPEDILEAARQLSCSSVLLVNVATNHPTVRPENWMYVYDEDKFSTRINCTEKLSPENAPHGRSGVQVEVYQSRHKPFRKDPEIIAENVILELKEIGLIESEQGNKVSTVYSPWANVIFTHETNPALEQIWRWLEEQGLTREEDDNHPITDWSASKSRNLGKLVMAGRFAQWKYFWTDDCTLRGAQIAGKMP